MASPEVLNAQEVTGRLKVRAPMSAKIDAASKIVDLVADLGQASLTFDTTNNTAQAVFQQEVSAYILNLLRTRGIVHLAPLISLVGTIPANTNVQELTIQHVQVQPLLSTGSNTKPCLALGVTLGGSAVNPGNLQNFLEGDDFSVIVSGRIMQAIAAFNR